MPPGSALWFPLRKGRVHPGASGEEEGVSEGRLAPQSPSANSLLVQGRNTRSCSRVGPFPFSSWIMRLHTPQGCWWLEHLAEMIASHLICAVSWLRPYLLSLHICRNVVGFPVLNLPHLHDTDFYGANDFATIGSSATKNKQNGKVRTSSFLKLQLAPPPHNSSLTSCDFSYLLLSAGQKYEVETSQK